MNVKTVNALETAAPVSARDEMDALGQAYEALRDLDAAAQIRAIDWLTSRLRSEQVVPGVPF